MSTETSFVTIAKFSSPVEAELLRGRLEVEGIRTFVADENTVRMTWLDASVVGGLRVQVLREDEQRARELITDFEASEASNAAEPGASADGDVCPKCGSGRVEYSKGSIWLLVLNLFAGAPGVVVGRRKAKCLECQHSWR